MYIDAETEVQELRSTQEKKLHAETVIDQSDQKQSKDSEKMVNSKTGLVDSVPMYPGLTLIKLSSFPNPGDNTILQDTILMTYTVSESFESVVKWYSAWHDGWYLHGGAGDSESERYGAFTMNSNIGYWISINGDQKSSEVAIYLPMVDVDLITQIQGDIAFGEEPRSGFQVIDANDT